MSDPIIELRGIGKRYGQTLALDQLDLTVGRGEIVGLLGPNGAGKSTAIKLLVGLVRPTSGTGRVIGAALGDRAARRRIGYLPELFRYQPWLRAREVLALHATLAEVPKGDRARTVTEALGHVDLLDRADDQVSTFSKGMQQRLGLAVALLGRPELVLLDEPTSALDPVGRMDVREIVRTARDRGATVILNSHLLTEVERVCDRVVIVHHGRVIAAGPLDDVVGAVGVRIRVMGMDATSRGSFERFGSMTDDGAWLAFLDLDPARIPEVVAAIVGAGGAVHAVEPSGGSLESRFLELVRDTGDPSASEARP